MKSVELYYSQEEGLNRRKFPVCIVTPIDEVIEQTKIRIEKNMDGKEQVEIMEKRIALYKKILDNGFKFIQEYNGIIKIYSPHQVIKYYTSQNAYTQNMIVDEYYCGGCEFLEECNCNIKYIKELSEAIEEERYLERDNEKKIVEVARKLVNNYDKNVTT